MAGNPTVIPGLFKADLSGLVTLAGSIGQYLRRDKQKLSEAMEIWRKPEYAEPMAERLVTAGAEAYYDLPPTVGSLMRGEQPENSLSRAYEAEMIAVNLDPSNPRHRQAAMSIFNTAAGSLDPARKALLRVGAMPKAQKRQEETLIQSQKNLQTATEAEGIQVGMTKEALLLTRFLGTHITTTKGADLAARASLIENQVQLALIDQESYDALYEKYPALRDIMRSGGPEAVTQALLDAHAATLKTTGVGALTPEDRGKIGTYLAEMEVEFLETLGLATEAGTEQEAMLLLSIALVRYQQKQAWMGEFGPRSKYPVIPVLYEKSKWFQKSTAVRLSFGLAPVGINVDPAKWGDWQDWIIQAYQDSGADFVESELTTKKDPYWEMMNDEQKSDVLVHLAVEGVFLPNLMAKYPKGSNITYEGPPKEMKDIGPKELQEPIFGPGKSAWSAGMEKVPDLIRILANWLPDDSIIQMILEGETEEE